MRAYMNFIQNQISFFNLYVWLFVTHKFHMFALDDCVCVCVCGDMRYVQFYLSDSPTQQISDFDDFTKLQLPRIFDRIRRLNLRKFVDFSSSWIFEFISNFRKSGRVLALQSQVFPVCVSPLSIHSNFEFSDFADLSSNLILRIQ